MILYFQYNLRAVLMHDGLYGPKNMYAYLYSNGNWFKSVWDEVIAVRLCIVIPWPELRCLNSRFRKKLLSTTRQGFI